MYNTWKFSLWKNSRIKSLILKTDQDPFDSWKTKMLPNNDNICIYETSFKPPSHHVFQDDMNFLFTWMMSSSFKKSWQVYLAEHQFHDDEWWLQGMSRKTLLQCHYNVRWGWGKQFKCDSMETPLPDHYSYRLIEVQEWAEPSCPVGDTVTMQY